MPPAVIAGGIAAAGTIGGAVLASKSQKKAATQANEAQQEATQAQLQLGQQSLALNQGIYNSNYDLLSPYVSRGNVAGDSINALLGLPAAPAMRSPMAGGSVAPAAPAAPGAAPTAPGATPAANASLAAYSPMMATPPAQTEWEPREGGTTGTAVGLSRYSTPATRPASAQAAIDRAGALSAARGGSAAAPTTGAPAAPTAPTPATSAPSATDAFKNFANSAGMQFQLEQGTNAINNMYAGRGALQSGAAMKAISDYGQQTALNNYFMPYMGLLSGQQAVGAGAASSVAGVGTNFGNTAANINAGMGNAIQGGADARSNMYGAIGAQNANMWNGIGSAIGGLATSFVPKPSY